MACLPYVDGTGRVGSRGGPRADLNLEARERAEVLLHVCRQHQLDDLVAERILQLKGLFQHD